MGNGVGARAEQASELRVGRGGGLGLEEEKACMREYLAERQQNGCDAAVYRCSCVDCGESGNVRDAVRHKNARWARMVPRGVQIGIERRLQLALTWRKYHSQR